MVQGSIWTFLRSSARNDELRYLALSRLLLNRFVPYVGMQFREGNQFGRQLSQTRHASSGTEKIAHAFCDVQRQEERVALGIVRVQWTNRGGQRRRLQTSEPLPEDD